MNQIKQDLATYAGYQLSDKKLRELLSTGRTSISVLEFAPYLEQATSYLYEHNSADWTLSLNSITGQFEIELKHIQLYFK